VKSGRHSRYHGSGGSDRDSYRYRQHKKPAYDSPNSHGRKIPQARGIEKPRYRDFGPHRWAVTSRPRENRSVTMLLAFRVQNEALSRDDALEMIAPIQPI
jgi:hypothetical protein